MRKGLSDEPWDIDEAESKEYQSIHERSAQEAGRVSANDTGKEGDHAGNADSAGSSQGGDEAQGAGEQGAAGSFSLEAQTEEDIDREEAAAKTKAEIQKRRDARLTEFVQVGTALAEIRDSRMYRATFKTFEEYCEKRWEFSKRQCDRLIQAAKVTENLGPMGPIPNSERQARPLAKLPAEKQPEAWTIASQIQ